MTRSNLFCSAHANVPVLSPTSVFLVFINEVTNASRRVITWPRDSHKRELLLLVPDSRAKRLKKKKKTWKKHRENTKKEKQGKKERKKAQRSGHPRGIIHRGGLEPGLYIRTEKLPAGRGELPAARGTEGAARVQGDTVGTFV